MNRTNIIMTVLLLWLGIAPSYLSAEPAISSCFIDQYLTQKSSPMVNNGQVFLEKGLKYVIDPRLVVAIAGAETTFGTHVCASFNAWNWFWKGSCSKSPFASWGSGATTVTKYLSKNYLNKGFTTIQAIGKKYCTSGCSNWGTLVTRFYMTELGGNPANLGLSSIDDSPCLTPNPECAPATCNNFVPCTGNDSSSTSCGYPVCASTAGGGGGADLQ